MTRESILFLIVGLLFGLGVGVVMSSTLSQRNLAAQSAPQSAGPTMPAGHPPTTGATNPQGMQTEVASAIEKARSEPTNFDAQFKAAQLYYQIQRFDSAIEFLQKANKIRPDDYQTIAALGVANLDAEHYDAAETWYRKAAAKNPNDIAVLAGICESTLQQGKVKPAEDAVANLEKVDPVNEDLKRFRDKLATLKSTGKT